MERPEPLAPRELRFAVRERMAANGDVLVPLDEDAVEALVPHLRAAGVEAVAVGFLPRYVNTSHDRRAAELKAEQRRDGKGGVTTGSSWGGPDHSKKKKI